MDTAEKPVVEIPIIIGAPFAGGHYFGRMFIGIVPYAIIVAPKAERYSAELEWNKKLKAVPDAQSYFDGLANTKAMAEAGSKLAQWALDLRISGKDDWFIPSRQDALIIHGNIPFAPAEFQDDGPEAFDREAVWLSTQHREGSGYAWYQFFGNGGQYYDRKDNRLRGVAVRRVQI